MIRQSDHSHVIHTESIYVRLFLPSPLPPSFSEKFSNILLICPINVTFTFYSSFCLIHSDPLLSYLAMSVARTDAATLGFTKTIS